MGVERDPEQGHTLVVSAYQFQVQPAEVSAGLLPLEPGEVPAEDRLFFDAPLLAAYRYTSRPFSLRLALSPLAQGDTLSQVVDRASLTTRISKEGQVLTDARYSAPVLVGDTWNDPRTNKDFVQPYGLRAFLAGVDAGTVHLAFGLNRGF